MHVNRIFLASMLFGACVLNKGHDDPATMPTLSPSPLNNTFEEDMQLRGMIPEVTIESFCALFNISGADCTCDNHPAVCEASEFLDIVQHKEKDVQTFHRSHGVTVIYALIAISSSVFGIIGNAVVIFVAFKQRKELSPCKLHIAELAVVNFLFSGVQILNVVPLYWTNSWIYGRIMCKVSKTILEFGSLLSSGFFQLIAIERYTLIMHALHIKTIKRLENRLKHILIAVNIIFVALSVAPFAYGLDIEKKSGRCVNFNGSSKWMSLPYNWFAFVVYSLIPIILTTVLAIKLTIRLTIETTQEFPVCREDVNKRVMLHILAVLSLFIICTLPSRLVSISMDMLRFRSRSVLLGFQFLSYIMYSLQGTLNPILYSMLAKAWRKKLSEVLRSMFCGEEVAMSKISRSITVVTDHLSPHSRPHQPPN